MRAMARWTITVATASLLMAGCDDPGAPLGTGGDGLRIEQEALWMEPGESLALSAINDAGEDITDLVTWTVGNPRLVRIEDASGPALLALGHGITWVKAAFDGARDSVPVTVPFASPVEDGVGLALGSVDEPLRLSGLTWVFDYLATGERNTVMSATVGTPAPEFFQSIHAAFEADTIVRLVLPGEIQAGSHTLDSWTVQDEGDGGFSLTGHQGVMVWIRDSSNPLQAELWVPVETIDLAVDEVTAPEEDGPATGRVVGRLAFEAAGLLVEFQEGPAVLVGQVTDTTRMIYAEFDVLQRIWPVGYFDLSVEGGLNPLAGARSMAHQNGLYQDAALLHLLHATPDGWLYATEIRLAEPAVGEFTFGALDPGALADESAYTGAGSWGWSEVTGLDYLNETDGVPESIGYGTGGTVSVSQYSAPTETTFGRITGTLTVEQDVYTPNGARGSQTVSADFDLALRPTEFPVLPMRAPVVDSALGDPSHGRLGQGDGMLRGRVVLDGATGVPNVPVTLANGVGSVSVVSDAEGNVRFSSLDGGTYSLDFEVPEGHTLAENQLSTLSTLVLPADGESSIRLRLADAEGNGVLEVHVMGRPGGSLNGVEIEVRPEGGDAVVGTMITGIEPLPGHASLRLQPGRYQLDLVPPDGFALPVDAPEPWIMTVRAGYVAFSPIVLDRI